MISCIRRIQFCAGHRIVGHEGKCVNVHGHNYVVFIHARADELDNLGRVIDFSVLKEQVGGWIDKFWDHTFIASPKENKELLDVIEEINNREPYVLDCNPTAENMAEHLLKIVCPQVLEGLSIQVFMIELWETENCFAVAEL